MPEMSSACKLIILPGWEQDQTHWQPVLTKLRPEFQAEAWDMPGFGSQPLVSQSWGVPEYAQWVKDQVEAIISKNAEAPAIVLLGHSFGGRVANYLACVYQPPWLKALILYGAPVIYRPNWLLRSRLSLLKLARNLIPMTILPPSWKQVFYSQDLKNSVYSGKEEIFRRVVAFDQSHLLPQNKYPTVLLWGARDASVSLAIAQELHRKYPRSVLKIVRDGGHNLHLENPNLFYGILKQILVSYC